ncbi:MAG: 3-phosphoshikimate 1-carboxyvinyltransferase [Pseudomonadota bacterium]
MTSSSAPPAPAGAEPAVAQPLSAVRAGPLSGVVTPPGDKSISHRALLFGALAHGETEVFGLLPSEDVVATAECLRAMGVPIDGADATPDRATRIHGRGLYGLCAPEEPLDFGNSGTAVRLMMGVLAGQDFPATLIGDASLSRRPMGRVLDPLRAMGLQVDQGKNSAADRLPLTVRGPGDLIPISYTLPVASAQVKSAILLAGLHAAGETTVIEPVATRDHTERMLRAFGADLRVEETADGQRITVVGEKSLQAQTLTVPSDPSSAAFIIAAALMVPGSQVTVRDVLDNPTRNGFVETVIEMGADVSRTNARDIGGETVVDLVVRHGPLRGVDVPAGRAPSMIDEYPMLAVVAATADGTTTMNGLAELRVKESDRLAMTAAGLAANRVSHEAAEDRLVVSGCGPRGTIAGGGTVATELDHRIAMAFLVLGCVTDRPVTVDDSRMIATSFPGFTALMRELGAVIEPGPAS